MSTLEDIKSRLDAHIGETVTVVSQAGRKKFTERSGILRSTFPSLFVVELDEEADFERASYSYTDVLTNNVDITFAD
ncbi:MULTISPECIES: Veg family protein [Fructobacillus]|jgi:uncharacterized protein Veg|uniref:DUF1021 family n=2 Tax=Fructobacillus TaxID=559173 RepID=A0A3F3H888_9LACO|nr:MULTISPECIES: Veg family protein [Fructobacillus]KMK53014.1 hypothetical protein FEFB_11680 [Fructobacillus sp. EFB-N1]MCK8626863.1 Veg family protein [Fructobacillus cardui]NLS37517.1 hypothetical protein [Fructobacillus tropaeoli]CAK1227528.1 DUF1021 family [Fructobacillus tropaeoli]CAK1228110.1 DUF1021 family [Fructobacillus cardui]